uniref:SUN domain-containing ossification factor n=1 Tax=Myripristis murdjan TaxID=586833 RepID=A0A667YZE4_9TELE
VSLLICMCVMSTLKESWLMPLCAFQAGDPSLVKEMDPSVPSKEDIPTFDEWKKQVMEVEKEKSQSLHTSTNGSPHPTKKVQKNFKNNYASVECGAKILSANNEAKSTSAILMENMDLYMLNPCSNKIWFVIELCEPIQVKQLDIANFELFSSTPKDFLVSISDRYPTNKWVKLGTFHARDERTVQSFPLDEQLYAKYVKMFIKYIKVELLSHFGSEHFCPLSLIRVFGTSMVEEYEEIADSQYPSERLEYLDEDYDYPPGYQPSEDKASKNLLGSATSMYIADIHIEQYLPRENNYMCLFQAISKQLTSPEDKMSLIDLRRESWLTPEEEEEREEQMRREARRRRRESQVYCPFSSLSSISLSCMATLPELLQRWCSARLAKERQRSLRRRQLSTQTQTPTDAQTPALTHTPSQVSVPVSTPTQEALPLTEKVPEPEMPLQGQNEMRASAEVHTPHTHPSTHTLDAQTPEAQILLEPSRTSTIPPHSFSHTSLSRPTPIHEEKPLPPIKDAALDPVHTPALQGVSVPETLQATSATPTLTLSSPLQPLTPETASSPQLDILLPSVKEQPVQPLPLASRPADPIPPPTELHTALPLTETHTDTVKFGTDSGDSQKHSLKASQTHGEQGEPLTQAGEPHRGEDVVDDLLMSSSSNGNIHRSATDFYAELQNGGDYGGGALNGNGALLNGGAVHGSSQKESVFMRLNNRIKALEMNMSLSSRYLEELSQRYRKQMEEMQRAFNKTIIKLQNTSRIAEEQDQKQTDSIQVLQSQLENVTKLMLNLTATVSQLQREVSDRQSYLVVSLVLCLSLGLLLCLQCCRSSTPNAHTNTAALPKSNHYPSPKRCFSSYDDMSLKRRVTCPLVRSKSFQLSSTEVGPDDLYIVEPLRFSPEKKVQCRFHLLLLAVTAILSAMCSGEVSSLSSFSSKECPSETSSCSSSTHSEESYTSRLPPPSPIFSSSGLCNGHALSLALHQPPAKSRQEKRSVKRRKSRQAELQFPSVPGGGVGSLPSLQQLMKGNKEISVGTIGVTAVTGHV